MTVELLTVDDLQKVQEAKKNLSVLFSSLFNFIGRLPNSRDKSLAFTHMEDCMMRIERAIMMQIYNEEKNNSESKEEIKEEVCQTES